MTSARGGYRVPSWSDAIRGLIFVGAFLVAFIGGARAADPCPAPLAQVVVVNGRVDLWRYGSSAPTPAEPTMRLCPGDKLQVRQRSQAALLLNNQTAVRLDQGTTVTFGIDDKAPLLDVSLGAAYVISRTQRPFRVKTPFINANIEGTEFLVEVLRRRESTEDSDCPQVAVPANRTEVDRITVYEGRVRTTNDATAAQDLDTAVLGRGQSASATGPLAPIVRGTVVRPKEAVAWTLHVPTILESRARQPAVECAARLLQVGRLDEAAQQLEGRDDSDAHALLAIIAVVRNDRGEAIARADKAVELDPASAAAWMARSYAQQASLRIEEALASAQRAHDLSGSALAKARLAELQLAVGNVDAALALAEEARSVSPDLARAQTVAGFTRLLRVRTRDAVEAFEKAIASDPTDPLPRLGLGLAKIRQGDLVHGREDIQLAVWLDPGDSVLRSYLGKAFYEERRDQLAGEQFDLAKAFDPNDPTPWFYDGLRKGADNRLAEAVEDLIEAIRLNRRRAVYRSQLLLDDDLAARSTSLARTFMELDLPEAALAHAATSLAADPGNASAHRFLSDVNSGQSRHEITRASELLQAQLRQPLSVTPLQAQLSNDRLFALRSEGPNAAGFNEFGSLFLANGTGIQLHGVAGSNRTRGEQLLFSGLRDNIGFGLSALDFRTDGVRPNGDLSKSEGSAFVHVALTPVTSVQFEYARSSTRSGDIVSRFDPDAFSRDERDAVRFTDTRFGLRHAIDGASDLLFAVTRRDNRSEFDFGSGFVINVRDISTRTEFQYLLRRSAFSLTAGFVYLEGATTEDIFGTVVDSNPRHLNVYAYSTYALKPDKLYLYAGLSHDRMHSRDAGDLSQLNPKLGLIWHPATETTVRAGIFRALKRRINSDAGLEPTHVAGFDQYFDDPNGTKSRGAAIAADFRTSETTRAGLSFSRRDTDIPLTNADLSIEFLPAREREASAYWHWTYSRQVVFAARVRHSRFERPENSQGAEGFALADTTQVPLSVKVFGPGGVWTSLVVTHVRQHGRFTDAALMLVDGSQRFTVADLAIGYRLAKRRGNASLECANLFNRSFRFQDIGLEGARFVPQRNCRVRLSLDF